MSDPRQFPFMDFQTLIFKTQCHYCKITIDQIIKLGNTNQLYNKRSDTRGYSLEIDRKTPNTEYKKDNCVMSCYWCNNAKTDEFDAKEFKPIANGIKQAWKDRGVNIKD